MQTKNILGITVSLRSLRESLSYSDYLSANIPLSTIHYITTRMLMHTSRHPEIRQLLEHTDMLVCADNDILRASGINSRARQYEIENHLYLKELCRQIQRDNGSFCLISESSDKLKLLTGMLTDCLGNGCKTATLVLDDIRDNNGLINQDELANEINDFAPRIIISNLSFPYQLQLMNDLKPFLNARIWLGLSPDMIFVRKSKFTFPKFTGIWLKFFKKKISRYDDNQDSGSGIDNDINNDTAK